MDGPWGFDAILYVLVYVECVCVCVFLCVCVGVGVSDLIISLHVTLIQTLNLITIVYHTFVVQSLNAQPVTQNRLGKYAERRAGLGNKQTGDILYAGFHYG